MTEETKFVPGVTEDINVTEKAVSEVKRIMKENNIPENFGLRIGIKGGGCSGFTYTMGFDGEEKPTDNVVEKNGIKILVDMKSFLYLEGTELDYTDGLSGKGFVFNNPNAKRTCGCGSSFGA